MFLEIRQQLQLLLEEALKKAFPKQTSLPLLELDVPTDKAHGEFSCNIALKSAKLFKKSPLELAQELAAIFEAHVKTSPFQNKIAKIEVKKPGFINFFLTDRALSEVIEEIFKQGKDYGQLSLGKGKKIQIEFVSANPTGPLSVAHARQAAVGDALANILKALGFDAQKEFYVNDEGNQINILGGSIRLRAIEILGEKIEFPEDHYQGEYIKDMASVFMEQNKIKTLEQIKGTDLKKWSEFGAVYLLDIIKKELEDFGVRFDHWAYQSKIATPKNIETLLDYLGEKGFLYEKDGALWFKSTDFGDDKDRVVEKSDGAYTYLTPDMVYHKNKFERGFDRLINLWGPDHHGYIPRIKAFVEAFGKDREALNVLIVQLATIYREGKPVSMSTRRGQYISLREVMEEVGVDAARFFFLMRHINMHLEFDLDLAKKQSPENPVYYIQYAHARVHSMNKKALEAAITCKRAEFNLLKEREELDLLKMLGNFPEILKFCYEQLDPYPLVSYLQELANTFHKFYDYHRVIEPQNTALSSERLALVNASGIVLANGLRLLGVSTPESM